RGYAVVEPKGWFLELWELTDRPTGEVVLFATWPDGGSLSVSQHRDNLSPEIVDWFRSEAESAIAPIPSGEAMAHVDPRWSLAAVLHELGPHEHWRGSFSEAYARAMESTEPGKRLQGWRTAAMILGDMHACLLCLLVCHYGRSLLPAESRDFLDHMDL